MGNTVEKALEKYQEYRVFEELIYDLREKTRIAVNDSEAPFNAYKKLVDQYIIEENRKTEPFEKLEVGRYYLRQCTQSAGYRYLITSPIYLFDAWDKKTKLKLYPAITFIKGNVFKKAKDYFLENGVWYKMKSAYDLRKEYYENKEKSNADLYAVFPKSCVFDERIAQSFELPITR
jgi:hypothetical protein